MEQLPPSLAKTDPTLDVAPLERYVEGWLLSGEIDQHSPRTLAARRDVTDKLLWFLRYRRWSSCGVMELRAFFAYVTNGHKEPGGRWANPHMTRLVRPRTVHTYHGHLRTLFRWIVAEGGLNTSPMERIPVPTTRADQIEPFSAEQMQALLVAARGSAHPRDNEAILLFLLDTGIRASELCELKFKDVDTSARRAVVRRGFTNGT